MFARKYSFCNEFAIFFKIYKSCTLLDWSKLKFPLHCLQNFVKRASVYTDKSCLILLDRENWIHFEFSWVFKFEFRRRRQILQLIVEIMIWQVAQIDAQIEKLLCHRRRSSGVGGDRTPADARGRISCVQLASAENLCRLLRHRFQRQNENISQTTTMFRNKLLQTIIRLLRSHVSSKKVQLSWVVYHFENS